MPLMNSTPLNGENIFPGATAVLRIPTDTKIHWFDLKMKAAAVGGTPAPVPIDGWADYVDEIRIKVNGDVLQTYGSDWFEKLSEHKKRYRQDGILTIYQIRPEAETLLGEDMTALVTNGLKSCIIEIDLKDNIVVNKLEVEFWHELPPMVKQLDARGATYMTPETFYTVGTRHLRVERHNFESQAAGEREYNLFQEGPYVMLEWHFSTADIGKIEVRGNNDRIYEMTADTRKAVLGRNDRQQIPGWTHVDFLTRDRIGDALPMNWINGVVAKMDITQPNQSFVAYAFSVQSAG